MFKKEALSASTYLGEMSDRGFLSNNWSGAYYRTKGFIVIHQFVSTHLLLLWHNMVTMFLYPCLSCQLFPSCSPTPGWLPFSCYPFHKQIIVNTVFCWLSQTNWSVCKQYCPVLSCGKCPLWEVLGLLLACGLQRVVESTSVDPLWFTLINSVWEIIIKPKITATHNLFYCEIVTEDAVSVFFILFNKHRWRSDNSFN